MNTDLDRFLEKKEKKGLTVVNSLEETESFNGQKLVSNYFAD
jgi:hypothetical protein